jgi:hypothetical protein
LEILQKYILICNVSQYDDLLEYGCFKELDASKDKAKELSRIWVDAAKRLEWVQNNNVTLTLD